MAGKSSIKVEGLATARARLLQSPIQLSASVQDSLDLSSRVVRSEAERLAPRGETGRLKRALRNALGRATKTFLQAFVFTLGQIAPHAHLIEFGTKPHAIKPKRKDGILAFGKYFLRNVHHPGIKPWPFFQMAVRNKRNQVRKIVERAVAETIARLNAQAA